MATTTTRQAEPFTLDDGYVTFHNDGSTELHIIVPPRKAASTRRDKFDARCDHLVTRLLELALGWQRDEA